MTCDDIRNALSARLDGEDPGLPGDELDRHLESCAACAAWLAGATAATRRVRLHAAMPGDDLTVDVLAALHARGRAVPAQRVTRMLLALTALVQIALSLPALLGEESSAGLHVAREIGATEIALAIGVLAAAWRPWRAAGMVPVVVALAAGLAGTTLLDVSASHALAAHELPHLVTVVEAWFVWRLRRQGPATGAAPPPPVQLRRVA